MKIVVIGSTGQLGTDLVKTLEGGHEVVGLSHGDIEVADYDSCLVLKRFKPDVVVNTAAFHKTDQCEVEPLKTFSVNALGARNVALVSKEVGATVVFVSTDYVFDGTKREPYTEDDVPCPLNTYGISKVAGEYFTGMNLSYYVVRIASIFGVAGASGKGGNFVETMIQKAENGEPVTVVDDMWMSPTYTIDASLALQKILEKQLPCGVYHVANRGYCSWFEFAEQIFRFTGLTPDLKPTKTGQLTMKAKRPMFSALKSVKLPRYGIVVPTWQEALRAYLTEKGHI